MLPKIIKLPLIPDEFIGKIGIAYAGSNPAFEIKFPEDTLPSNLVSIDLKDKDENVFPNTQFNLTKISNSSDKLILSLKIPDNVSKGTLNFNLNLADGKRFSGLIEIIDFIELAKKEKTIGKPQIAKITTLKKGRNIILNISGNNFAGDENASPNTTATLFPTDLNASLELQSVSKNNKNLVLKLSLPDGIEKSVRSVISISTPRGIVSAPFVIKK